MLRRPSGIDAMRNMQMLQVGKRIAFVVRGIPSSRLCGWSRGMAREHGARLRGLDTREAAKLLGLDRDLLSKADLVGGTTQEADTIRVEGLVDRGSARLGTGDRDAAGGLASLLAETGLMAVTQVLDDGCLHRELDQVHGHEPDDVLTDK